MRCSQGAEAHTRLAQLGSNAAEAHTHEAHAAETHKHKAHTPKAHAIETHSFEAHCLNMRVEMASVCRTT